MRYVKISFAGAVSDDQIKAAQKNFSAGFGKAAGAATIVNIRPDRHTDGAYAVRFSGSLSPEQEGFLRQYK